MVGGTRLVTRLSSCALLYVGSARICAAAAGFDVLSGGGSSGGGKGSARHSDKQHVVKYHLKVFILMKVKDIGNPENGKGAQKSDITHLHRQAGDFPVAEGSSPQNYPILHAYKEAELLAPQIAWVPHQ